MFLQAQVVPWKLWAAVAGLLAIDVILLLVWTLVDPLSREVSIALLLPPAILPYIMATNLFGSICSIIITLIPQNQHLQVRNFPKLTEAEMPNPEADIEIVPQLEHCKSRHHNVWLGE